MQYLALFIFFLIIPRELSAHTFVGMIGFYDGISHPVLGFDHFLAMVCVGIISAQIGGKAIWTLPFSFVIFMIFGGTIGILFEINKGFAEDIVVLGGYMSQSFFSNYLYNIIEYGIIFSVILLGFCITMLIKIKLRTVTIFVIFFGFCHGMAHGLEMPWAVNPIFFSLGFGLGTAALHLFGVLIGYFSMKSVLSKVILRIMGSIIGVYGLYLLI